MSITNDTGQGPLSHPDAVPFPAPPTAAPRRRRRRSPHPLAQTGKGLSLLLIVLVVLFPLYTVVLTSFSTQSDINRSGGMVVVPGEFTTAAYQQILSGGIVTRAAMVSILVTTVGTVLSTTVSILAAYGLSRPSSLWHRPILFVF